ncbi:UDP-N-acetylmuramate [Magnetococcus marinus MC-1]|uniref:UDP-N-acetylmuramate--L-alanyl-gamma-D-glutamyl-meso-2,6-diaminoheptandioate ligase n=1 Tax=Magnetococcus marinus (strain ATCC BAA-1437 / JCM 17883 / MC-1) TaxID=156889 RepID=A0L5K3_MAGMM|nr:UDP-N-acetylmuramate:L-alanyl-gamma-D-glutamyl-meso-diaminopimelate ligase [Magnetococcus marinus]ABK43246.1 UDP-N-acetylmuramate [Magnetococcus marinus MC-1]
MAHLHVIGICGTAMANLAALAKIDGWHVTGSDAGVYPPMSTFLEQEGIEIINGFSADNLKERPDLTLVGNTISRGNPELEALMDSDLAYMSGAEWFQKFVLEGRHPIVATGTHGKTTTSSMLARLWEEAGWEPGFLIGGIPADFGRGSRFPKGPWVVVEGDEYDTAFYDKRPKFLHYRPRTLILNNLEFDHADIYADLEAIRVQFRLLLRTVPRSGVVLINGDDEEVTKLAEYACSPVLYYGIHGDYHYRARLNQKDGSHWTLIKEEQELFDVAWGQVGMHNIYNGLAAASAALEHGMPAHVVKAGLEGFSGVARRLQVRAQLGGVTLYDDFAHHPTAIKTTLEGLRAKVGQARIWAIIEPRSNTMRRKVHQSRLAGVLGRADRVIFVRPEDKRLHSDELLNVDVVVGEINRAGLNWARVAENVENIVQMVGEDLRPGDHLLVMSNGGFDGLHGKLEMLMQQKFEG